MTDRASPGAASFAHAKASGFVWATRPSHRQTWHGVRCRIRCEQGNSVVRTGTSQVLVLVLMTNGSMRGNGGTHRRARQVYTFLKTLAGTWAGMVRLPGVADGSLPAARGWVAELTLLDSPAAVHERVRRTHPGLRVTGTTALLHSARDGMTRGDGSGLPVQGAGELLLTVLATSDGEKGWRTAQGVVTGWDLFKAHGHFVVGVAQPSAARWQAHRAYRLAADQYAAGRSDGAQPLAALASFAAAVAGRENGGTQDMRTALDRLAAWEPEAAAALEAALEETGKPLDPRRASTVRTDSASAGTAGRAGPGKASAASSPAGTTLERAEHLQREALRLADAVERAVEKAREADRLLARLDRPPTAMTALVDELDRRKAWRDALRVLDEQRRAAPKDKEIVHRMARCHAQLGDWPGARGLLTELMGYRDGEHVGIRHMATLQVLCDLAVALGQDDGPEFKRWTEDLESGVPFTHFLEGGPERRTPRTPRTAMHMDRRGADGYLNFNPGVDYTALSEKEAQVHLLAAMAAFFPERERAGLLRDFAEHDPDGTPEVVSMVKRNVAEEHFRRGERHLSAGRFDQAQREYETAVEQDPDHPDAWHRLGGLFRRRGQHHLAQAYCEESLAVEPTAQAHALLAACLLSNGAGPRRARKQYEKALELDPFQEQARQALAELDEHQPARPFSRQGSLDATPDLQEYIRAMAVFLGPLGRVGRSMTPSPEVAGFGDAVRDAVRQNEPGGFVDVADDERGAAAWIAAADPHRLVRATLQAQWIAQHYHDEDQDTARWKLWAQRMLRLAQTLPKDLAPDPTRLGLGRDRLLAYAFAEVAEVRIADHELPEAQAYLRRARDLLLTDEAVRRETGAGVAEYERLFTQRSVLAAVLHLLASVCRRLGDRVAALTYAHEAQQAGEDRPTTRAEVGKYVAAGSRAMSQGKKDFGMGAFHEAVRLAEDEDPRLVVPGTLIVAIVALGRARHLAGMHRSALACFAQAQELEGPSKASHRATSCHLDIARVLRARPDIGEALGGDARHHAERELLLASVRDATGAGDESPMSWTASDGVRYRVVKDLTARPALLELAGLLQESGEDDTAVRLLTMVTFMADLLLANAADVDQRIAIQNEQVGAFAELTRIHVRRADGDTDAGRRAWAAHEAMRARTFLDALGEAELTVPAEVPAGLVAHEARLLARRATLRAWMGERSPEFWESYREVQGELDHIWAAIRQEAPAAAAYTEVRQGRPADSDEITKTLTTLANGRTVVLANLVVLDDTRLGVIALRSDGSGPHVRGLPADVGELARFVRQNFGASGRVRPLAADMEDLFQHQLAPVADLLASVSDPGDVLLVCPTGFLHHVPLGAVDTGGQPLLARNPVSLLPSGSFLRVVGATRSGSERPGPVGRRVAVFGDPTGDLHGTRAEALRLAGQFGVRPVLGRDVTVDAVIDALARTSVLHVAGHARFDATDPLNSGLVLADGLLTARDIIRLRAPNLSLVTLSACETGVSATDAADELAGLTRALLLAGADSVLVSLWKVPDGPTADIMAAFYDGVGRRGLSRSDALREAVLAARENNGLSRFDRWAGFQLIGDWR